MKNKICCLIFLVIAAHCYGYNSPGVALGTGVILDGGPIRPKPGFYWVQSLVYYHTNRFLDECGNLLGGVPSPEFESLGESTQLIYQFPSFGVLHGAPGFDVTIPAVLFSRIGPNPFGINTAGAGLGDIFIGAYFQRDTIMKGERPIFVFRLEFAAGFPAGKNNEPEIRINPGNNVYVINPYWAATLYFRPDFALSWRLNYRWSTENCANLIQAGDAIYCNFALEASPRERLWLALNGYYLRSLHDNKRDGVPIPNSREQVLGLGPGALYFRNQDLVFITNLYFESHVRNRTQGLSFVLRMVKHF